MTITSAGGYLTWLTLRNVEAFSNPASEQFVAQPEYLTLAASGVAFVVALVFMSVFDVCSDTILFCWALDKKVREEKGLGPNTDLPESLVAMLDTIPHVEERLLS